MSLRARAAAAANEASFATLSGSRVRVARVLSWFATRVDPSSTDAWLTFARLARRDSEIAVEARVGDGLRATRDAPKLKTELILSLLKQGKRADAESEAATLPKSSPWTYLAQARLAHDVSDWVWMNTACAAAIAACEEPDSSWLMSELGVLMLADPHGDLNAIDMFERIDLALPCGLSLTALAWSLA